MEADESFPAEYRLRSSADFQRVFQAKCSVADDCLVVYGVMNQHQHPRLGLSVSRKVGNAVCRNYWKRSLREAFRKQCRAWELPIDVVVIPRREVVADAARIDRSLRGLIPRLKRKLMARQGSSHARPQRRGPRP
jgi:ribonuclease P protein component